VGPLDLTRQGREDGQAGRGGGGRAEKRAPTQVLLHGLPPWRLSSVPLVVTRYLASMLAFSKRGIAAGSLRYSRKRRVTSAKCASCPVRNASGTTTCSSSPEGSTARPGYREASAAMRFCAASSSASRSPARLGTR